MRKRTALALGLLAVGLVPVACGDDSEPSQDQPIIVPPGGSGGTYNPGDGGGQPGTGAYGANSQAGSGQAGEAGGSVEDAGPDVEEEAGPPACQEVYRRCEHTFTYPAGSETSVELRGTFSATGWDNGFPMTRSGSEWTVTLPIPWDYEIHYKFVIDGTQWVVDPNNPTQIDDGQGGKKSVLAPQTCDWWECVTDPAPGACGELERSCSFKFQYNDQGESSVAVAGSFNGWQQLPMQKNGSQWSVYVPGLAWGSDIQYKFVLNGNNWVTDPSNPNQTDDGYGGKNSLISDLTCEWWECAGGGCGDAAEFDWRDAVMYFAMVDRFYDSDNFADEVPGAQGANSVGCSAQYEGGDLKGVTDKMGYLADLGVSAIWLSAPYENRNEPGKGMNDNYQYSAYHGYWPAPANINYGTNPPSPLPKVESRIGTSDDLKALINSAHGTTSANGHGIKILFDYVMNHVDINSGLYQAHKNDGWFASNNGHIVLCAGDSVCGGECWNHDPWGTLCSFTDYLPAFDYRNPAARKWSIDDALWWAKEYGIDGYRLDAIKHVPMEWLTDLRARLNSEFPAPAGGRFYLVGETYTWDDYGTLAKYVDPETKLDGQFDFPFRRQVCRAALTREDGLDGLARWMDQNDMRYGPGALMSTWLGNHDIPRVIHTANGQAGCEEGSHGGNSWQTSFMQPGNPEPYERLGVAFAIMLTNPGLPLIYYGDEIGLAGGGDPDNRRMMVWNDAQLNQHQKALRDKVKKLAKLRGENKALTRGVRQTLSSDGDSWVYRRGGCGDAAAEIIVAINRGDGAKTVNIPQGSYVERMSGNDSSGGSVNLPPRSFMVFESK